VFPPSYWSPLVSVRRRSSGGTPARLRDGLLVVDRDSSQHTIRRWSTRSSDLASLTSFHLFARPIAVLAASIGDVEDEACGRCRPLPFRP